MTSTHHHTDEYRGNELVLFGSAVDPKITAPNDIDVAYDGEWTSDKDTFVRSWLAQRGLDTSLPIDAHPWIERGTVQLPQPCHSKVHSHVLAGDVTVRWRSLHSLSATLRAYGHAPRRLERELARFTSTPLFLLEKMPPRRVGERLRDLLRPPQARERHESYGPARINLYSSSSSPWRHKAGDYTEGVVALRSAAAKAPALPEVLARIPDGGVLTSLIQHDPVVPTTNSAFLELDLRLGTAALALRGRGDLTSATSPEVLQARLFPVQTGEEASSIDTAGYHHPEF